MVFAPNFGKLLMVSALTACGLALLINESDAAIVSVTDPDNILITAVTNPDITNWGRYGRAFSNMYDNVVDDSTDGGGGTSSANVIIPTTTVAIVLNLDASYNLTDLIALTGGFDRYAASIQFETSTNGGSSWTDRGTVTSDSFTTGAGNFDVASVSGSFSGVNALRYTIVSSGLEARVGELQAMAIPEPGVVLLSGLGVLLMLRRRRCA